MEISLGNSPGQEGWLRHQVKVAKLPLMEQTGWLFKLDTKLEQPPRRFAPPLLVQEGPCRNRATNRGPVSVKRMGMVVSRT